MKAILFKTDGTQEEVKPMNGKEFEFREMYGLLNCNVVEHVWLGDEVDLWCDEEGLIKEDWQVNEKATAMYRAAHPNIDPKELVIVGYALVVDNTKAEAFFK